jgi:hypothetical protein
VIVEVTTFKLASGVSEESFLAADGRAQTGFFYLQRGIVRRTTARGADGTWSVVTFWGSEDDALAAEAALRTDAAASGFASSIIDVEVRRFETLD